MREVIGQPPNIEEIRKVFTFTRRVIFCYGDTIYNPDNIRLDEFLIAHEQVHSEQQAAMGVEVWWKRYLAESAFRISQEIPAYRKQYQLVKETHVRPVFKAYGKKLALSLSGDTYGNAISYEDALEAITKE